MPKVFSAPLVVLMGPTEYPSTIKDTTQIGSLFTLLLHAPLKAFSFISDITTISTTMWTACSTAMQAVETCVVRVLDANMEKLDKSYTRFLQDDFLRQFVTRFIVGWVLLNGHSAFVEAKHLPLAHPAIPNEVLESVEIRAEIKKLVGVAEVGSLYDFSGEVVESAVGE
jgi:hypothetical protein